MSEGSEQRFIAQHLERVAQAMAGIDASQVRHLAHAVDSTVTSGGHIYFMGNGGSATTATHYVNDLVMAYFRSGLTVRATSLADNAALVTGVANDYSYDDVFEAQLKAMAREGDMAVAISASGNSPNLVRALEHANHSGLRTVAITGFDGGSLRFLAQLSVHVPTRVGDYGPTEDAHLVVNHALAAYLRSLHTA